MKRIALVVFIVFFGYGLCFVGTTAFAETKYDIVDLGLFEGGVHAEGINDSGQAVFNIFGSDGHWNGYVYENNSFTPIAGESGHTSIFYEINSAGNVAGYTYAPDWSYEKAKYYDGTVHDLSPITGLKSRTVGINDSNILVGYAQEIVVENGGSHGVNKGLIYQNQSVEYVGPSSVNNTPYTVRGVLFSDINNSNQVAGHMEIEVASSGGGSSISSRAIVYQNGGVQDLGIIGDYDSSRAWRMNDNGLVIGALGKMTEQNAYLSQAFVYKDGAMQGLGSLYGYSSSSSDINNLNQIVGSCIDYQSWNHTAYLYENGAMYDLNGLIPENSGWSLWSAGGINDNGWIVGDGEFNGEKHAFLLNPIGNPEPVVPEPATMALFGLGLLGAAVRRRRRKR